MFKEFDFQKLPYKVFPYHQQVNYFQYPLLKETFGSYKNYCNKIYGKDGINKIIRYIIVMYDKRSPFHYKVWKNPKLKKVHAAKLANFDYDEEKNEFPKEVLKILANKDTEICTMIALYLRMQHSIAWTSFCTHYEIFYNNVEKMLAGTPTNQQYTAFTNSEKHLTTKMEEMTMELEEVGENLKTAFFMVAEEEKKGYRPENIIKKMVAGEYVGKEIVK